MTRGGDIIGGWRLDCGCVHQLLAIRAGAYESIHCPLHAAAPALLDALETAYSILMDGRPDQQVDYYTLEARVKARAAIAQAKGQG